MFTNYHLPISASLSPIPIKIRYFNPITGQPEPEKNDIENKYVTNTYREHGGLLVNISGAKKYVDYIITKLNNTNNNNDNNINNNNQNNNIQYIASGIILIEQINNEYYIILKNNLGTVSEFGKFLNNNNIIQNALDNLFDDTQIKLNKSLNYYNDIFLDSERAIRCYFVMVNNLGNNNNNNNNNLIKFKFNDIKTCVESNNQNCKSINNLNNKIHNRTFKFLKYFIDNNILNKVIQS
jgi:hypothetical protein